MTLETRLPGAPLMHAVRKIIAKAFVVEAIIRAPLAGHLAIGGAAAVIADPDCVSDDFLVGADMLRQDAAETEWFGMTLEAADIRVLADMLADFAPRWPA